MKALAALIAVALLMTSTNALAYKIVLHPSCPGINKKISWREYLSGDIPSVRGHVTAAVGVQFTKAKRVNDPRAIGRLATNQCYNIIFHPGPWRVTRISDAELLYRRTPGTYESFLGAPGKHGLRGDPWKFEINVHGVLLFFNEGGEVLNRRGRVVGRLVCYWSNECGGY